MAAKKKATPPSANAQVDTGSPRFQRDLEALGDDDFEAAISTLELVASMPWSEVYRHRGFKWEEITSVKPPPELGIDTWYSIRFTRGRRMRVYRQGNFMRCVDIPPDHDSTYQ